MSMIAGLLGSLQQTYSSGMSLATHFSAGSTAPAPAPWDPGVKSWWQERSVTRVGLFLDAACDKFNELFALMNGCTPYCDSSYFKKLHKRMEEALTSSQYEEGCNKPFWPNDDTTDRFQHTIAVFDSISNYYRRIKWTVDWIDDGLSANRPDSLIHISAELSAFLQQQENTCPERSDCQLISPGKYCWLQHCYSAITDGTEIAQPLRSYSLVVKTFSSVVLPSAYYDQLLNRTFDIKNGSFEQVLCPLLHSRHARQQKPEENALEPTFSILTPPCEGDLRENTRFFHKVVVCSILSGSMLLGVLIYKKGRQQLDNPLPADTSPAEPV